MSEVTGAPGETAGWNEEQNSRQEHDSTWESLSELNTSDKMQTTWDDLSQLGENIKNAEKDKSIVLTDRQIKKLNAKERLLYCSDPTIFTQVQNIKQKHNTTGIDDFIGDLARQFDQSYWNSSNPPGNDKNFCRDARALNQIANIYDVLGNEASAANLFHKDATKINEISHYFDIASAEMPLEQEVIPARENLIQLVIHKLNPKSHSNSPAPNTDIRRRNDSRHNFIKELVCLTDFDSLDDVSLQQVSKLAEKEITKDKYDIADNITKWLGKTSAENIAQLASMQEEIGSDHYMKTAAFTRFYNAFGVNDNSLRKFRNEILPLIQDKDVGGERAAILASMPYSQSRHQSNIKVDFAIQTLMPDITKQDKPTVQARKELAYSIFNHDVDSIYNVLETSAYVEEDSHDEITSLETYNTIYRDANEHILPFMVQHSNELGNRMADRLVEWQFQQVDPENLRPDRIKLDELVAKSNDLLSFIEQNSRHTDSSFQRPILSLAFDRKFEPSFVEYLKSDLLPRVDNHDESVGSWAREGNMMNGELKYREYDFDCLTAKITPQNVNELLLRQRELPTSDVSRLEQNRIDALAIEGVVIPDHTFIHREHSMTNPLLSAMVDYYDARKTGDFEVAKQNLATIITSCPTSAHGKLDEYVFDLKNYNKPIRGDVYDGANSRTYDTPAIEVLRRLVENTRKNELEIPDSNDKEWRELMENAGIKPDLETGKMRADWDEVAKLTRYTNDWLINHQDKYGLGPAEMKIIAFTERAATFALRNISEKERKELPYDDDFEEIIKLQELIGSYDKFNPKEFDRFWEGFRRVKMDDTDELRQHYWRLVQREMIQAGKLTKKYATEDVDGIKDAGMKLQSGNLLAEIIMLMEPRDEDTIRSHADRIINR